MFPWYGTALFCYGISSNLVHLQCWWDGERAEIQRGSKRVCQPLRLKLPHFFPCMYLAWTIKFITPSHSICASSPCKNMKTKWQNNWCMKNRFLCFPFLPCLPHFCNSSSVNHCAVRAVGDVRLGELRLPLIKILVWERAAFNVTKTCMHFYRAACSRSPSKLLHNHTTRAKPDWLVATCVSC